MAIALVAWAICAISCALIFRSKNRSTAKGALLGAGLGLIGILIAACLSTRPALQRERVSFTRNTASGPTPAYAVSMPPPPIADPTPGWYSDPDDATRVRYWEGGAWTSYTDARPSA
jgi:hypothetical protein